MTRTVATHGWMGMPSDRRNCGATKMQDIPYESARIERALNRIQQLCRLRDAIIGPDVDNLRRTFEYEMLELEKEIDLLTEHVRKTAEAEPAVLVACASYARKARAWRPVRTK